MKFLGGNQSGRSAALVPWGPSGKLLMPLWPEREAYVFQPSGAGLVVTNVPVAVPVLPVLRPGSPGSILDASGNSYTLPANGNLTLNGQAITGGNGTTVVTYASGQIWAESAPLGTGAWFIYTPAGGFVAQSGPPPGWNGVSSTSATAKPGFVAAVPDASGNAWLLGYTG